MSHFQVKENKTPDSLKLHIESNGNAGENVRWIFLFFNEIIKWKENVEEEEFGEECEEECEDEIIISDSTREASEICKASISKFYSNFFQNHGMLLDLSNEIWGTH